MNVLFTVTYYDPYISGLTLAVQRWATGLSLLGHQVTILTMQYDQSLPRSEQRGSIHIRRIPWIMRVSKGFFSVLWWKEAWQGSMHHDAIVLHLPQPEAIIVALAAKLHGKRVISVYHCEVTLPRGIFPQCIQAVMEGMHFFSMLLSDHVVTYTSDYAQQSRLIRLWQRYTKKRIVAIIPPIPQGSASQKNIRDYERKVGKADIVLGLAARIAAEKGIEYLLAALPLIAGRHQGKRVVLAVAGPVPVGEEYYNEIIAALVKQRGHDVVFLGGIPPERMGSFYRCLDVLLLPSVNSTESFGMVQVEAMLQGIPVIATALPGVRVPIQKTGMGIIVPPKNAVAIADAVTTLLNNPHAYRKTTTAIRRTFPERESAKAMEALLTS